MANNSRRTESVETPGRYRLNLCSWSFRTNGAVTVVARTQLLSGDFVTVNRADTGVYTVQVPTIFPNWTLMPQLTLLTPTALIEARVQTQSSTAGTFTINLIQLASNSTVAALVDVASNAGNFISVFAVGVNSAQTR